MKRKCLVNFHYSHRNIKLKFKRISVINYLDLLRDGIRKKYESIK